MTSRTAGRTRATGPPRSAPGTGGGLRGVMLRSAVVGLVALAFVGVFWASRPEWTPDMRLWRAVGDASIMLLAISLAIGPAGRLFP